MFSKARVINTLGNQAEHSHRPIQESDALMAVRELFHVGYWLARTYARGAKPAPGLAFDANALPRTALLPKQTIRLGATYGRAIKRVVNVHWLRELGIAQALWVLEVERLGPFLVEGDREGKSLFALANREIDARLGEIYRQLQPYVMGRFGETTSRREEIV